MIHFAEGRKLLLESLLFTLFTNVTFVRYAVELRIA